MYGSVRGTTTSQHGTHTHTKSWRSWHPPRSTRWTGTKIDRACELHSNWRSADFLQIRGGIWFEFLKFPTRRVVYRIKNYTSGKFSTSGGKWAGYGLILTTFIFWSCFWTQKGDKASVTLRQVWSWTQRQVAALDADAGSHSVLFFLQLMTAAAWRICLRHKINRETQWRHGFPQKPAFCLLYQKNVGQSFQMFHWFLITRRRKVQPDPRTATRARSLLFLSEFEAIFSCSVMDQARKVRIAAVFLLTSSYWLSFLGLLTTTQHSQVNRLQLADDPLKQLVLSRLYFLLRKRLALSLPPGSEQSSIGLVGPRTHLEKKGETKQTLKRRMSNVEWLLNSSNCLETKYTWKTLFFRKVSLPSAATQPISPRQTQQRLTLKLAAFASVAMEKLMILTLTQYFSVVWPRPDVDNNHCIKSS